MNCCKWKSGNYHRGRHYFLCGRCSRKLFQPDYVKVKSIGALPCKIQGVGSRIAGFLSLNGFKKCSACQTREKWLNRMFPF